MVTFDGLDAAITIPHRWQEGDVSVVALPGVRPQPAYAIRFHPSSAPADASPHLLATIRVFDVKEWDGLQGHKTIGTLLARVGGKAYIYAAAARSSLAESSAESERFNELVVSDQDATSLLKIEQFEMPGGCACESRERKAAAELCACQDAELQAPCTHDPHG